MYSYYCRPAYGSEQLLIEFLSGADKDVFFKDLLHALAPLHPVFKGTVDLWMNDEILVALQSDQGPFEVSFDNYDFIFIMSRDNQACIKAIDNLLQQDNRFEKLAVDFNKYK
jgi:hypothetical protein